MQVRALYTFTCGGNGELSFQENEYLTIIKQDIGEGWWEAKNTKGETGLVPESYLEEAFPEPTMPPPPVPPPTSYHPPSQEIQRQHQQPETRNSFIPKQESIADNEWDDDDWDEDEFDDTISTRSSINHPSDSKSSEPKTIGRKFGGSKFSGFSKSGGDAYLFDEETVNTSISSQVTVCEDEGGYPQWNIPHEGYTCEIKSPKKETKYHGMKSFIVYQITPTITNIQVSRRYKHFDWLHARLEEKFTTLTIPPLPDKQVTGRYQTDFIEQRMQQLRKWISRMCRHPVIARSEVFVHFMTVVDEKLWKSGKRKAEKDEYRGAKFFVQIASPSKQLDPCLLDNQFEDFSRFVKSMEDSVKQLSVIGEQNIKRRREPFKKDFMKMGYALCGLSKAFEYDERPAANRLTLAIDDTGKTFDSISQLIDQQPGKDMIPMLEAMHEYKGILSTFPDTLSVYRTATQKIQEVGGKLTEIEVSRANQRAEVIAYTTLAEINHFQNERVQDFNEIMKNYIKQQISFYTQITEQLQKNLEKYE